MTTFVTDQGLTVPAVTSEQMGEVDRIAIEEESPSLLQMMENAGRNLALAAIEHLGPRWRETPIAVYAGPGGNGGGGICAARHLGNHGGDVILVLVESTRLTPVGEQQLAIYRKTGRRTRAHGSFESGLILDAVFGYGLHGSPRGHGREMIQAMKSQPHRSSPLTCPPVSTRPRVRHPASRWRP